MSDPNRSSVFWAASRNWKVRRFFARSPASTSFSARGPSAVNATYEGIRCATGEYRVYARQVQGNPWTPSGEDDWKSMRGQTSVMVQHPYRLARDGMCIGTGVRQTVADMVRELKSGNRSLYY